MEIPKIASLPNKLIASVVVAFLAMFVIIYLVFRQTNENALYTVEREKARMIVQTVAPLLTVDLYLGLHEKTDEILHQLGTNPDVVSVRLETEDNTAGFRENHPENNRSVEYFTVRHDLYHPVTAERFATLFVTYSSAHISQLSHRYNIIFVSVLGSLALLSIVFAFYLRQSFLPLQAIAAAARRFKPGEPLALPSSSKHDEIGLITEALNEMSTRITDYTRRQENIAQLLEKEVGKKTAQLRHQLYTDRLTGLPNRAKLMADINDGHAGTLILINIDDFKQINNFYGHVAGDHVLLKLGQALARFTPAMKLYKLSADEYALMSAEPFSPEAVEARMTQLFSQVESLVIVYGEAELSLQVTAGIAPGLEKGMEKADIALKAARSRRKPWLIYCKELELEHLYEQNMRWLKLLNSAIEEKRIVPYYQPIFDNETGAVKSYECLIRLLEKDGSVLLPQYFLPVSKKARLYHRLTHIMVEETCRYFSGRPEMFSVNLSVDDITDEKSVAFIRDKVQQYGVTGRIIFEILESEGIENYVEVSEFIRKMKLLGCRFAIDDFGSGYSNFEHLLHLDIDFIKIDGSLIQNLDSDPNSLLIVEAIINIAQKRNLQCIAEFVHNADVLAIVKRLGIRYAQGFHLGKPQPEILPPDYRLPF